MPTRFFTRSVPTLISLEPARNPNPPPADLVDHGLEIFARETCVQCHVPPNYTSGKLTLAQGFTPPADHPNQSDIAKVSGGTDGGLTTRTRKGTGFYKIPSLRCLVPASLAARRFGRQPGRDVRSRSAEAGSRARRMERAGCDEARDPGVSVGPYRSPFLVEGAPFRRKLPGREIDLYQLRLFTALLNPTKDILLMTNTPGGTNVLVSTIEDRNHRNLFQDESTQSSYDAPS